MNMKEKCEKYDPRNHGIKVRKETIVSSITKLNEIYIKDMDKKMYNNNKRIIKQYRRFSHGELQAINLHLMNICFEEDDVNIKFTTMMVMSIEEYKSWEEDYEDLKLVRSGI